MKKFKGYMIIELNDVGVSVPKNVNLKEFLTEASKAFADAQLCGEPVTIHYNPNISIAKKSKKRGKKCKQKKN